MVPSSTAGRRTSCCDLLHRWTSSTNRTVGSIDFLARSITLRASATPDATAESWTSSPPTLRPRRYASVVFPLPAGPHNSSEGSLPDWARVVSAVPSPIRGRCPTTSSIVAGRMRVARGTEPIGAEPISGGQGLLCPNRQEYDPPNRAWGGWVPAGYLDFDLLIQP